MPTSKIKKDVREGLGTKKSLEKKWDKAKEAAGKGPGGKPKWPLVMHIYQNMTHQASAITAANAVQRLAGIRTVADSFEGWINALCHDLKCEYDRQGNKIMMDADINEVVKELKHDGWAEQGHLEFHKGKYHVRLEDEHGETEILDVK